MSAYIGPKPELLEISPFEADGGHSVGRCPSEVPPEILAPYYGAKNPLRAIREKCVDCSCGVQSEVRKCVAVDCALWPYRMGKNPFRKKLELTPEQGRKMAERLPRARAAQARAHD